MITKRTEPIKFERIYWGAFLLVALLIGLVSCQNSQNGNQNDKSPPVIEVTAVDYTFSSRDTVKSGWNTFRMTNNGKEHHLFVITELPEGVTYSDFHNNVAVPLDSMRTLVREGSIDTAVARKKLVRMIPDWFPQETKPMGGVSLTAPGRTATTTLKLKPGTYVMECYVRTKDRKFHFLEGMAKPLVATTDSTDAMPPEADMSISLSKGQMQADSVVSAGARTIAVHYGKKAKTDPLYLFNQHLHLARLEDQTSPEDLADWMKWDPVMPSPVEFLGGPQSMLDGSTAYMHVDLSPGRYAWILGNPPKEGDLQPFIVK